MNHVAPTHDPASVQSGHLNRRQFLQSTASVGVSLAGLALLEGCGPQSAAPAVEPPPETTKIRIPQIPVALCVAPLYLAEDLLKAEGFTEVQYVKMTNNLTAKAIAAGEADIGMQFSAPSLLLMEAREPLVILGGVQVGCFELFGNNQVRSIRDLKGKTAAIVEVGGPEHVFISSIAAYVGVDPNKDINWATLPRAEAKQRFIEGKIDAYLGFPPDSLEVRAKKVGQVILNSMMDKPWSQYFCCMVTTSREFMRKNPVATKRALRAIMKATDLCAREQEKSARFLVDKGYTTDYNFALQSMQELPFDRWREYDPEDTLRFYALRLNEIGMIKSSPNDLIARSTDWRFLNELKKELKG